MVKSEFCWLFVWKIYSIAPYIIYSWCYSGSLEGMSGVEALNRNSIHRRIIERDASEMEIARSFSVSWKTIYLWFTAVISPNVVLTSKRTQKQVYQLYFAIFSHAVVMWSWKWAEWRKEELNEIELKWFENRYYLFMWKYSPQSMIAYAWQHMVTQAWAILINWDLRSNMCIISTCSTDSSQHLCSFIHLSIECKLFICEFGIKSWILYNPSYSSPSSDAISIFAMVKWISVSHTPVFSVSYELES